MSDDDLSYLEPDFNPNSLTMAKLRSILVAHNVEYPSSAKKPDLVSIFNDNVAAQAKKIRTQQARTKRTSKGIVSVSPGGRALDGRADQEDEDDDVVPLETPARRPSARKSMRASTEEIPAVTPRTSRSTRQSTAPIASSSARVSRAADQLDGASDGLAVPKSRRQRQSTSPAVKEEEEEPVYHTGPTSPFTQDNPFQSGSPPRTARSKSGTRRRTTHGTTTETVDDRKSRQTRRRTEGPASGSSPSANTAVSRLQRESDDHADAGEEFTPDEQLELETALAGNTRAVVRRSPKKRSGAAKVAPWSVLVALLGGLATVWRQEKLNVGYCGIGSPSTVVAGVEIPEWAATLQPQCEPCPPHAYCYSDLKTVCEPDFVLTPHPLSLNGVVPLPPTCEPDGEKAKKVKAVADFAVEKQLRERNAQYECGEVKKPEISIEELKTTVASKRSRKMSDQEFEELWESALGDIMGREEVITKGDASSTLVRSSSLARVPFTCAIRRSVRATIKQHLSKLVVVLLISLSAVYGKHSLTVRKSTSARAKVLAHHAMGKLEQQASFHAEDPATYPESWISMVALRDDVLREEFNANERGRLWNVVKGLVEGNTNVRSMVREGRSGEVSKVWEWIGPTQRLESPEGRRGSSRFSLGAGRLAGSITGTPNASGAEDSGREMTEVSKWSEGNTSYY